MVVTEAAAGNQEMRKYAGKVVVSSKHCYSQLGLKLYF